MARPRSYNRTEAIERACHAFWEHGYTALGVRALEVQTGLNKFAIRNEFGGKEGLYLEALQHYHSAAKETVMAPMRSGGIETIADFFEGLVTEGGINSSAWGCLMVNTGVENAEIQSPALKQASDAYWTELGAHFSQALNRSHSRSDIALTIPVAEAAQGLVTAVIGIHTTNRVAGAHDAGRPLVRIVLDLLETWRT